MERILLPFYASSSKKMCQQCMLGVVQNICFETAGLWKDVCQLGQIVALEVYL